MPDKCQFCGSIILHSGVCPTVKAIEYHPDGAVKRVEFKCAGDWVVPLPSPLSSWWPPREKFPMDMSGIGTAQSNTFGS